MASWSLNRPGIVAACRVAWLEVGNQELRYERDPRQWLERSLQAAGWSDAVGLMTARNVASHQHAFSVVENVRADCVVTLGLNNGEHVGRRSDPNPPNAGTINILCSVSSPLTDGALLEAAALVTQARTAALLQVGYRRSGRSETVTGTGTDCVVMSAPILPDPEPFAGMHTAIGEAVGDCVLRATLAAASVWLQERSGASERPVTGRPGSVP